MLQNFKVIVQTDDTTPVFIPDCTNDPGRMEVAIKHTIPLAKFDYYKAKQPGGPLSGTRITVDEIRTKMNTPVSGRMPDYLRLQWDGATNVVKIEAQTGQYPREIDYSVCLFNGIELLDKMTDPLDYFMFYKAIDLAGMDTIVFSSVKQTTDTIKNYYDLSNDRP